MSHAATGQSRASGAAEMPREIAAARHRPSERVSDIALADAVALAVRGVPGVADLSAGSSGPVATYGPGRSVAGVAVYHPTLDAIAIEVHVVLSEAHCARASAGAAEWGRQNSEQRGPVTEVANGVRGAARTAVAEIASLELERVDVFIDDLQ